MILDKSPEGLEFFGTDNADFLIMHFDTDLEFDTVFFGRKTVEFVQGLVFWVSGSGSLDDFKVLVTSKIQTDESEDAVRRTEALRSEKKSGADSCFRFPEACGDSSSTATP